MDDASIISKNNYRPEIDGLRALAVMPVILYHAKYELISGGFVGVDVFFVISGYLITNLILESIGKGDFSLLDFYARRARRLLPAMIAVVLVSAVFAIVFMSPVEFKDFSQSVVASVTFAANIHFMLEDGYFDGASALKPLLHIWSLAVEEQFYLIYPLILIVFVRPNYQLVLSVIFCLFIVSLFLSEYCSHRYPDANFFLLPFRMWELLAGSLTAILLRKTTVSKSSCASMFGLLLVVSSFFFFDAEMRWPSLLTIVPIAGVVLILSFTPQKGLVFKFLTLPTMVKLGLISYSAYLAHYPIIVFARLLFGEPSGLVMFFLVCLSLTTAYFLWRFVETPFRKAKFQATSKLSHGFDNDALKTLSVSLLCVLGLSVFGMAGHLTNGLIKFKLTDTQKSYFDSTEKSLLRDECHTRGINYIGPEDSCILLRPSNNSVAVFGDSHVVELAYAIGELLNDRNISNFQFSFSGCGPDYNAVDAPPGCREWASEVLEWIGKDSIIETVIIAYRLDSYVAAKISKGISTTNIFSELNKTIVFLKGKGKKVIFVNQAPELSSSIDKLIIQGPLDTGLIGSSRAEWVKTFGFYKEMLYLSVFEADLVNTIDTFCDEVNCYAGRDGVSYYFDDNHLSLQGARKLVHSFSHLLPNE